ncbi:aprataxin isoform X1 [Zea mays]|uniref:aprataxin isoform X1 n=1 Tax=Zea mays TaxID=4577 RepID=UPI0009AA38D8|nr:aprataxin isoform X1 [Zea mays]|eukprot:XP_020400683.1 aprataxin isoform X1 [Zea mays]
MRKTFCFGGRRVARKMSERAPMVDGMIRSWRSATSTRRRSGHGFISSNTWHYLVIPIDHIPTVNSLRKTKDDHQLVSHMVKVGKDFLNQDAPNSEEHRFGFHQPPFNSIDHLHLHCLALPFIPSWRQVKYTPLGPLGGFIAAEKLLERIKPEAEAYS